MNEEYEKREEDGLIRVVVVDDHQVVRDGLRMMLEILGKGFALVGDAADGASALRLVEETQPDVVLMDLRMPGMEGLEAIRQMRARWPQIAVVILTTYNEDDLMLRGLQAGACGYLLKDTNRETLFQAIRCAARGETLLQPDILARLLSHTVTSPSSSSLPRPLDTFRNAGLTERERTILAEVARDERSKEIAARLGITTHTVAAHLTSIYNKLGGGLSCLCCCRSDAARSPSTTRVEPGDDQEDSPLRLTSSIHYNRYIGYRCYNRYKCYICFIGIFRRASRLCNPQ